ncbi:MAG: hypothetical protein N2204_09390 [Anaerolineae bacterium]|nr:hypothetical protein [Anaerolineae bacterium]
MTSLETVLRDFAALPPSDQERVAEYIAFLRWRAGHRNPVEGAGAGRSWRFNFLEHFAEADMRAVASRPGSRKDAAGMEVKIGEASVGGELRPALWQHPPVSGESQVEFHVLVPAGLRDLRLRFSIGIRDGAQGTEQLVAFRIKVDGWQVWSRAAYPRTWQSFEVTLPFRAGNVLRLAFATDGLGVHQWAWAVWGEPELVGLEA